jgi:hypothetical protein
MPSSSLRDAKEELYALEDLRPQLTEREYLSLRARILGFNQTDDLTPVTRSATFVDAAGRPFEAAHQSSTPTSNKLTIGGSTSVKVPEKQIIVADPLQVFSVNDLAAPERLRHSSGPGASTTTPWRTVLIDPQTPSTALPSPSATSLKQQSSYRIGSADLTLSPGARTVTYTKHVSSEGLPYYTRSPSPYRRDHPEIYRRPISPTSRMTEPSRIVSVAPVRRSVGSYIRTVAGIVDNEWLDVTLAQLKYKLEQRYISLSEAFRALDIQKTGFIETIDLARKLEAFNLGVSTAQLRHLAETLDSNGDGLVTYHDFITVMQ